MTRRGVTDQPDEGLERGGDDVASDADAEGARKRLRDRVFGEVLPESTRDDRDLREPDAAGAAADEWLRRNVPPHHG